MLMLIAPFRDENGGELPERKVYSYMNIRTKVRFYLQYALTRADMTYSRSHGAINLCSST